MKKKQLEKDLKASGSSPDELAELSSIAEQLEVFKSIHLSEKIRHKIAQIPDLDEPVERQSWKIAFSSIAVATAAFLFVLLGYSQIMQPELDSSPGSTEQVREEELVEIETKLQESESQLQELQQVEEISPEVVEEAENKYEQAYDRWRNWHEENDSDASEYDDRDRWRRRSDSDVQGTQSDDENDEEQQTQDRYWRR